MWKGLAEEIFFFQYHLNLAMSGSMSLPINLRKWMIERFIEQKEKENEAMEASRRKAQSQSKSRR
jgi:hypothetical protein